MRRARLALLPAALTACGGKPAPPIAKPPTNPATAAAPAGDELTLADPAIARVAELWLYRATSEDTSAAAAQPSLNLERAPRPIAMISLGHLDPDDLSRCRQDEPQVLVASLAIPNEAPASCDGAFRAQLVRGDLLRGFDANECGSVIACDDVNGSGICDPDEPRDAQEQSWYWAASVSRPAQLRLVLVSQKGGCESSELPPRP